MSELRLSYMHSELKDYVDKDAKISVDVVIAWKDDPSVVILTEAEVWPINQYTQNIQVEWSGCQNQPCIIGSLWYYLSDCCCWWSFGTFIECTFDFDKPTNLSVLDPVAPWNNAGSQMVWCWRYFHKSEFRFIDRKGHCLALGMWSPIVTNHQYCEWLYPIFVATAPLIIQNIFCCSISTNIRSVQLEQMHAHQLRV